MMFKCRKSAQAMVPGMLFLAVANLGGYLLRRSGTLPENLVDGVSGLLMGVAIGLLLVGMFFGARGLGCGRSSE
jgi:hypothetical protein